MQLASIKSISVYTTLCQYFVAIVPPATRDNGEVADSISYSKRGWCRLEQMAFVLSNGLKNAFLFDGAIQVLSERKGWVDEAINVFEGNFTCNSDKPLLVDVVLGLFGYALLTQQAEGSIFFHLLANKKRIFPSSLFEDMVQLLEEGLVGDASDAFFDTQQIKELLFTRRSADELTERSMITLQEAEQDAARSVWSPLWTKSGRFLVQPISDRCSRRAGVSSPGKNGSGVEMVTPSPASAKRDSRRWL